jgi:hypothetical protein
MPYLNGPPERGSDVERLADFATSGFGDLEGAVVLGAPDPIEAHDPVEQRPSEAAGQVMALLASIDEITDGALAADGSPAGPLGKVPRQVTLHEAHRLSRRIEPKPVGRYLQ